MTEKTCSKCGYTGDEGDFSKNGNWCKKCRSEYNKNYRENNPEYDKQYRLNNSEKIKEQSKKRYANSKEKGSERHAIYYKNNTEAIRDYQNTWRQTPTGQESMRKSHSRDRSLGHKPINNWFKGAECHHLRYSKNQNEQDNDVTLYVPAKLHRSIKHNGNTGYNMKQINIACLEWYIENTQIEDQNPKALKLYDNYKTLPEPDWNV